MSYQFISGRQQLISELNIEAQIIEYNLAAPLLFNDKSAAQELMSVLALTPRIIGGAVYDKEGHLFIYDCPTYITVFKNNLSDYENESPGFLKDIIKEDIIQETTNIKVGTLILYVSYNELLVAMTKYGMGIIIIGVIGLYLHRKITLRLRSKVASTEDELEQLAYYDKTTSLPNRKFFEKELDKAILLSNRSNKIDAILFIDVDNFKRINDLSGHHIGDIMLSLIAERIRHSIRGTDVLARVGANAYAVLLYDVHAPENAARIASQIINSMGESFMVDSPIENVSVSIGLTLLKAQDIHKDKLLKWQKWLCM